jgi:hypothetical protein
MKTVSKRALVAGVAAILLAAMPVRALIYLPENTLESLLVRSDSVVIGTVAAFSDADNRATIQVDETCKGTAKGTIVVTGVRLRLTSTTSRPRFAAGDQVVLFLAAAAKDDAGKETRAILHTQVLNGAAEIKTMSGCIAEVSPMAQVLADLADIKKPVDEKGVLAAAGKLVVSKNGYSQILLGRLMETRLAERVKPDEALIVAALETKRKELLHGAMVWAGKMEKRGEKVEAALRAIAGGEDAELAKQAKGVLEGRK